MPTVIITWHALPDACNVCKALHGYQWIFETGKDFMTDALWHPQLGIVWSLALGSNAHGRGYLTQHGLNCRCTISVDFNLEDVLAKCVYLRELAQAYSEPYIPWRGGGLFAGGEE